MNETKEPHATDKRGDEAVVLMYPDNQLRGQVRTFEETFSAFTVLKETFFASK